MTELETILLTALDDLQRHYGTQQKLYQREQAALRSMFERTLQDNAALREQLDSLNGQVEDLSRQLVQSGLV